MLDRDSRVPVACLFVLIGVCLVPIWAFKYFPTTDGASHLENADILLHLGDAERDLGRYYRLNPELHPNWFSHLVLATLMTMVSPLIAEKILLTAYVVLFMLTMVYYLKSVNRESGLYALLAAPFAYNYTLQMGFYNYTFSIPLMFAVLGFWWRRRARPVSPVTVIVLNATLIGMFFVHLVSLILTLVTILGFALILNAGNVRRTVSIAASLTPSFVLPAYYVLNRGTETIGRHEFGDLAAFFRLDLLVSLHPDTRYVAMTIALVFAVLIVATLFRDEMGARPRIPRIRVGERDLFLLAALGSAAVYWLSPSNVSGGAFMHERLAIYPFLLVLPWLTTRIARPLRHAIAMIAVLVTVAHLTLLTGRFVTLNRLLDDYTSGIEKIEKNDVILTLCFEPRVVPDSRINPFIHAQGYYCVEAGAIQLANYEAHSGHFPLTYTAEMDPYPRVLGSEHRPWDVRPEAHPEPVDFILVWFSRGDLVASRLAEHYEVVHRRGRLTLLGRKLGVARPR